jgi:hypothetical protein
MNFSIGGQKKYGLITKKPVLTSQLKKSVFHDVDDDEVVQPDIANVNREMARARAAESDKLLAQAKLQIESNPDLYDYDTYVDTKKEKEVTNRNIIVPKQEIKVIDINMNYSYQYLTRVVCCRNQDMSRM